ncbi:MAG TPA: hypothetical protein VMG41_04555, partial [Gemmatimonadales bacterium]|nr:hypothetical protein [Gemmatimonadales bacterium]
DLHEAAALSEQRDLPGQALMAAAAISGDQAIFLRAPALASATLDSALKRHPLASIPPEDRPYAMLAIAYALAGQPAFAKQLLVDYDANVSEVIRKGSSDRDWANGYLALGENRAQEAIQAFRLARDHSACTNCGYLELAQAYDLAKQPDSALAAYARVVDTPHDANSLDDRSWNDARAYRRLGELYDDKGDRQKALDYYGRFVDLWKDADLALQPQVKVVKERMAKLSGEGGR